MINFQSASENKVVDVSKMKVGDSCSYRVMSKCGFPKVEINSTDIFMNMAYLDLGNPGGSFDDNIDNSAFSAVAAANGKRVARYPGSNVTDSSCGKMRRMFVTIIKTATTP